MTTHCVIYARVSTTAQTDGVSLETQVELATREAERLDLVVEHIFNYTMSGFRVDNLEQFSDDLKKAGFDDETDLHVIVYTIDRFSRNILNFELFLQKWPKVKLISTQRHMTMTTEDDRRLFRCDVVAAQAESEKTSRRVRDSLAHRKRTGTYRPPATPMFGVTRKRDRESDEILETPIPREQKVMEFIRVMCSKPTHQVLRTLGEEIGVDFTDTESPKLPLDGPAAPSQMAEFLNHHGILRRNAFWTPSYIRRFVPEPPVSEVTPTPKVSMTLTPEPAAPPRWGGSRRLPLPVPRDAQIDDLMRQLALLQVTRDDLMSRME